jgi:hypothetical protein
MTRCDTHPFNAAADACRHCARQFCGECLVYAYGPDKKPMCVGCALVAAGVRIPRRGGRLLAFT